MQKENNFFWPSYSDLMTSLFFIMLVLYILTYIKLKNERNDLLVKAEQLEKIKKIEKAINEIDKEEKYYKYDTIYKKHILCMKVKFGSKVFDIESLGIRQKDSLYMAGKLIQDLLETLKEEKNIKYLVIIEGQASKIPFNDNPWQNNNTLSYLRALSLKQYWEKKGLLIEKTNCELIVCGSGEGGVPRIIPSLNKTKNEINSIEEGNQRFLVHIIAKPYK